MSQCDHILNQTTCSMGHTVQACKACGEYYHQSIIDRVMHRLPVPNLQQTLDQKLEQLLRTLVSDNWHDDEYLPTYLKALKQAFENAGYVHIPSAEIVKRYEHAKKAAVFMLNGQRVMTGQEWYDKFKAILPTPEPLPSERNSYAQDPLDLKYYSHGERYMHERALRVAKNIAGIK